MTFRFTPRRVARLLMIVVAVVIYAFTAYKPQPTKVVKPVEVSVEAVATVAGEVLNGDEATKGRGNEVATVTRVLDGDTIEIEGGQTVRYIGIDTPETVKPQTPVQCFGEEAKEENSRLIQGKTVRLEKDISETDRYGRLLRYVYVDDTLINEALVKNGFAQASTYPPDVKYQKLFLEAQIEAREQGRGLWGECLNNE